MRHVFHVFESDESLLELETLIEHVPSARACRAQSLRGAVIDGANLVVLEGALRFVHAELSKVRTRAPPVVAAVVGLDQSAQAVIELFRMGISDCLLIPSGTAELECCISRLLPPISRGDASEPLLRPTELTVVVAGAERRLSRTQFALLQYLVDNCNRWVTKAELLSEVLRTHHAADTSVIRVHVHQIRTTLGSAAVRLQTDTRGRRGYRWQASRL